MSAWQRAGGCLRAHRHEVRRLAAAEVCLLLMLTGTGALLQSCLRRAQVLGSPGTAPAGAWEVWLAVCMAAALLVLTPMQVQCAWILGEMTGVLDGDDLGFLRSSRSFWLWRKMLAARLLLTLRLLLSLLPALLAWAAAGTVRRLMPAQEEGIFALLTAAHLMLAGAGLLMLPLRVLGIWLALPLSFLKMPHRRTGEIVRNAALLSRRRSGAVLLRRLLCLPLLMLPPAAAVLLPRLAASELLWANRRWVRCCGRAQMRL